MSTLLFYENVVPLNRERHRGLRLKPVPGDFTFTRQTPFVPMAGSEFFPAAKHYPVLFSGTEYAWHSLFARNLFVDADGAWAQDVYVPAFVRRYPFVLAGGQGSDEFTVCVDDTWKGFNDSEGEALFTEEGEQTDYLKRVLDFVQRYHAEMQRTQAFIARLRELELLTRRDLQITDEQGGSLLLKDFQVVDEERFSKLDDEVIVAFHKAGWLPWVYAHLLSLGNLPGLQRRLQAARKAASQDAAGGGGCRVTLR